MVHAQRVERRKGQQCAGEGHRESTAQEWIGADAQSGRRHWRSPSLRSLPWSHLGSGNLQGPSPPARSHRDGWMWKTNLSLPGSAKGDWEHPLTLHLQIWRWKRWNVHLAGAEVWQFWQELPNLLSKLANQKETGWKGSPGRRGGKAAWKGVLQWGDHLRPRLISTPVIMTNYFRTNLTVLGCSCTGYVFIQTHMCAEQWYIPQELLPCGGDPASLGWLLGGRARRHKYFLKSKMKKGKKKRRKKAQE